MRDKLLYATLISGLLFAACIRENIGEPVADNKPIEISFRVVDFTQSEARSTKSSGSQQEQSVDNLYLFLFNNAGTNPERYYIESATFAGGTWDAAGMKVKLDMTQTEAGARQVYAVANIDAAMKTALDGVAAVTAFQTVFRTTAQPWSPNIASAFLMTGNKSHNFAPDHLLDNVPLIRAVAKIELNVKLSALFRVTGNDNYKHRLVNFDTRTYVEKPASKPDNLASSVGNAWPNLSDWTGWSNSLSGTPAPDAGLGYTTDASGKITALRLITYLNERDNKGAAIEIALPRVDDGELPPPEFGPELYRLPLPDKIQRNHWYKYDVEI